MNTNRRNFLGLFTAASAAVGLGIVPAFTEDPGKYCIRYVEAFDVMRGEIIHRIDIATGEMRLKVPKAISRGVAYQNVKESQISGILASMGAHLGEALSPGVVSAVIENLPTGGNRMVGVSW